MTDAELVAYWRYQALHFKRLAVAYQHELQALKNNTPVQERHHGRGLHTDPTASKAVNNVTRQQRKGN